MTLCRWRDVINPRTLPLLLLLSSSSSLRAPCVSFTSHADTVFQLDWKRLKLNAVFTFQREGCHTQTLGTVCFVLRNGDTRLQFTRRDLQVSILSYCQGLSGPLCRGPLTHLRASFMLVNPHVLAFWPRSFWVSCVHCPLSCGICCRLGLPGSERQRYLYSLGSVETNHA